MATLFGGLAAVLALYAFGGLLRLQPLLRALLAGAIPLVGYFILIIGRWPGLDVVAIHISVFLVTALVLLAMSQFRRRGAERMHWAPKLLAGFFVTLVFINATLLYISTQGLPEPIGRWWLGSHGGRVYSGFSGVVPHNQDAAKAVSSELSEAHREALLGWQVEVIGLDGSGLERVVEVRVKDRTGLPVDRLTAELRLQRPGSATTVLTLPLVVADAGLYRGALTLPSAGRWLAELRLMQHDQLSYRRNLELVVP